MSGLVERLAEKHRAWEMSDEEYRAMHRGEPVGVRWYILAIADELEAGNLRARIVPADDKGFLPIGREAAEWLRRQAGTE